MRGQLHPALTNGAEHTRVLQAKRAKEAVYDFAFTLHMHWALALVPLKSIQSIMQKTIKAKRVGSFVQTVNKYQQQTRDKK